MLHFLSMNHQEHSLCPVLLQFFNTPLMTVKTALKSADTPRDH